MALSIYFCRLTIVFRLGNSNIVLTHSFFCICVQIFWSESGELVCIATEESFFILKYQADVVEQAKGTEDAVTEDGIENAFDVSYRARVFIRDF